jgi:hypothetical protein
MKPDKTNCDPETGCGLNPALRQSLARAVCAASRQNKALQMPPSERSARMAAGDLEQIRSKTPIYLNPLSWRPSHLTRAN